MVRHPAKIKKAGPAIRDHFRGIFIPINEGNEGLRIIIGSVPKKKPAMTRLPPADVPLAASAKKAGVKVAHGKNTVMRPSKKSEACGNFSDSELKLIFKNEVPLLISL